MLLLIIPKISSPSLYTQRYTYTIVLILLVSIIIGPYSYYTKKGLIYIAIIAPFSH